MIQDKKKVVIIGGGFAGAYCAQQLEKDKNFQVTLIDSKNYFEFTPSILRTLVEPKHIKLIQTLHSHYLHHTKIIRGHVVNVTENEVHIRDQEKAIPFDYLIVATGSSYNSPIKEADVIITSRAHELREHTHKLEHAKQILIIGGGVVGTELAAEIAEHHPEIELIVAHARSELIERNPKKARDYAKDFLKKRGVKFHFQEKVIKKEGRKYFSNKGTVFEPDMVFLCVGITPNSKELGICSSTECLTEKSYIKVNQNLQVGKYKHIFAAGDVTSIKEEKTAQNAEKQAKVVVRNIRALEEKEMLKEYHSQPRPMVISLAKTHGVLIYKNFVLTGKIPAKIKAWVEHKTMKRFS